MQEARENLRMTELSRQWDINWEDRQVRRCDIRLPGNTLDNPCTDDWVMDEHAEWGLERPCHTTFQAYAILSDIQALLRVLLPHMSHTPTAGPRAPWADCRHSPSRPEWSLCPRPAPASPSLCSLHSGPGHTFTSIQTPYRSDVLPWP